MKFVNRKGNTIGCKIVNCRKLAKMFLLFPERRPYKGRWGEFYCGYHARRRTRLVGLTYHEYADLDDRIFELVGIR